MRPAPPVGYPADVKPAVEQSRRPLRAMRNDRAIFDAATRLTAADGWAGLLFPRVAADAGLSVQPLHERFTDREHLAVALWQERLSAEVLTSLSTLIGVMEAPNPSDLNDVLALFTEPSLPLQAASELMMLAATTPPLLAAIENVVSEPFKDWLTPQGRKVTKTNTGRHGYALALALGLMTLARRYPGRQVDLSGFCGRLCTALNSDVKPTRLPQLNATHLDEIASFGTDDPAWEDLLTATLMTVGKVGYDRATVTAISQAAGYTKGLLFRRYATKRDLFIDATQRIAASSMEANVAFQKTLAASLSPGVASAVMIREFMRPGRELLRNIYLEQLRLAIHDHEVRTTIDAQIAPVLEAAATGSADQLAFIHTEQAMANGIIQLQVLWPGAWELPFDVVEVPLNEATVG
jgi:AcrR family transcriptional regulator